MIGADALFGSEQEFIAKLSLRYAVPVIHQSRAFGNRLAERARALWRILFGQSRWRHER